MFVFLQSFLYVVINYIYIYMYVLSDVVKANNL